MTKSTAIVVDRPAGGGAGRITRIGREATVWLLRSRMGRLMGGSLTVITHSGRTSGRRYATPVEYVRDGSRVTILVARPERKQWWRNIRDSGAATLWLDGRERDGSAIVLAPLESTAALAAYVAARPRAAAAASGALAVVVDLSDDVAA